MGDQWALERGLGAFAVGRGWGDPPKHPAVCGGEDRGRPRCGCSGPAFLALPAQLLATLLIQYERLRGVQSSGVLIIFWFLCVVCAIVPFRSKILAATAKVRGERETCQGQPCPGHGLRAQSPCGVSGCPSPAVGTSSCIQSSPCCPLLATSLPGARTSVTRGEAAGHSHCGMLVGVQGAILQPPPPLPSGVSDGVPASILQ